MARVRVFAGMIGLPVLAGLGLGACGGDGGTKVSVELSEWVVQPSPASVAAGKVRFVADNKGGKTHEMVLVRASSASALPLKANGAVDESKLDEANELGEAEDVTAGSKKTLTVDDIKPGRYVLFCNVVETAAEGGNVHFKKGMHASVTVTS